TPEEQALVAVNGDSLATLSAFKVGFAGGDFDLGSTPVLFGDAAGRHLAGASSKDDCFYAFDVDHLSDGPVWRSCVGTLVGTVAAYDPTTGNGGTLFLPGFTSPPSKGGHPLLHAVDP